MITKTMFQFARLRCALYPAQRLGFGAYYHHLVARGLQRRTAMMVVMRKMLAVAYRLLKTQHMYDLSKAFAQIVIHSLAHEPHSVQPRSASSGWGVGLLFSHSTGVLRL